MERSLAAAALTLAIVASVFAIWPVVADAPWEDGTSRTDELRCEAALSWKADLQLIQAGVDPRLERYRSLEEQIGVAERDIRILCR